MKTKQEWLRQLRRCNTLETLDKVTEQVAERLTTKEIMVFMMAVDHRKAEITMRTLYDIVPVSVWKYVK